MNSSVTVGQKNVDVARDFCLFLVTEHNNPRYGPEMFVKVAIVNFAITSKGLEEQMLAQIVQIENQQLEQRKIRFMEKEAEDKE